MIMWHARTISVCVFPLKLGGLHRPDGVSNSGFHFLIGYDHLSILPNKSVTEKKYQLYSWSHKHSGLMIHIYSLRPFCMYVKDELWHRCRVGDRVRSECGWGSSGDTDISRISITMSRNMLTTLKPQGERMTGEEIHINMDSTFCFHVYRIHLADISTPSSAWYAHSKV